MEKEVPPESLTTVTIKPDYPPSEIYSSEPPPAYPRSKIAAVQVAKIIAVTVVLVSIIFGCFMLASAYITANSSCRQLEQELELLRQAADTFQESLQPEALTQEDPRKINQLTDTLQPAETKNNDKIPYDKKNDNIGDSSAVDNTIDSSSSNESDSDSEENPTGVFKLPLQLQFDDIAEALIKKNEKSRMNCIVEKKRAEQVTDHQAKTIALPFGLNLTTDPRYEHLTGERMVILCESGDVQKQAPREEEEDEDTVVMQPVILPILQTLFSRSLNQPPVNTMSQEEQLQSMETMRPPMPSAPQVEENDQPLPIQVLHRIAQEIITDRLMNSQREREQQAPQMNPQFDQFSPSNNEPVPEKISQRMMPQFSTLPNPNLIFSPPQEVSAPKVIRLIPQMVPKPQEARMFAEKMHMPQEIQGGNMMESLREQQQVNGREPFVRLIPVQVPVSMQGQEKEEAMAENSRPHYVQPRSVRSVDALLPKSQKRVKRCSCDCTC